MTGTAIFGDVNGRSTDVDLGKDLTPYRYVLTRENLLSTHSVRGVSSDRPLVVIGTNPSIATADLNDPTIKRDMGFAISWGCGRLVKVNLHGWRDTDPKNVQAAREAGRDIVGVDNVTHLKEAMISAWRYGGLVLCAWGKNASKATVDHFMVIVDAALEVGCPSDLQPLYCIKTNKDGSPIHTLYQPAASRPIPWAWQS